MNVLQNLTELYNTLSYDSTYRNVVKGILDNLSELDDFTIYDIAELTNSSRTTVWRMVQKLGYRNFSDFRYALQSAVSQYGYYNRMLEPSVCSSNEKILENIKSQIENASTVMESCFTAELLDELVQSMKAVETIHFYMPYRMAVIESMQQNLAMDGKKTAYQILFTNMLEAANELDNNSIVIMSAIEFAETLDMKNVFVKVKEKGAKIWLAGHGRTKYHKYVDRMLLDVEADSFSWLIMLEAAMLALSEAYRISTMDF